VRNQTLGLANEATEAALRFSFEQCGFLVA
jgi:hypothetical protein